MRGEQINQVKSELLMRIDYKQYEVLVWKL